MLYLLLAALGLQSASGQEQEFDWSNDDLPEWIEDLGYEDADYDGPPLATVPSQGATTGASRAGRQPSCDCLHCRSTLTGDWCGVRPCLRQNGIIYRGRVTQFGFGVAGGVQEPVPPAVAALGQGITPGDRFDYTGTSQHDFIFALDKFGGLPHSRFLVTMENIWGRFGNVSGSTGDIAPIFNTFMPADSEADGIPRMTNFFYLQPLSESLIVGAGKLRMPGVADQDIFAGGDGTDQFVNQVFAANPMFPALMPISAFAVTVVTPQEWGNVRFLVIDPKERSTEYFEFDSLFSQGLILLGEARLDTNFLCKPGHHHIGGVWKHADLLDLQLTPLPPEYPYPPGPPGLATKPDSWMVYYGFDQYLRVFDGSTTSRTPKGWGLFGRAGLADGGTGNPNFVAWTAEIGIGGDSPLQHRRDKGDRFGVGYAYTATSTEWGDIPTALLGPRDSQVIEAFYRYHLTPSIQISPDVQWVRGPLGGLTGGDDAFVYGLRMNIVL